MAGVPNRRQVEMRMDLSVLSRKYRRWCSLISSTVVLGLLSNGCETMSPRVPPVMQYMDGAPTFMLVYYPYGVFGDTPVGYPIPRYSGWTDERMERDLRRFTSLGVDIILLAVYPEYLNGGRELERITRFVEFCGFVEGAPKVVFLLTAGDGAMRFDREKLGAWVVESGIRRMSGVYTVAGKPLVVVRDGVMPSGVRHPAVHEIVAGTTQGCDWYWPSEPGMTETGTWDNVRIAVVYTGWAGTGRRRNSEPDAPENGWKLPRRKGLTLQDGLWRAFSEHAGIIIVCSWNDFRAGDFVEPNNLDGQEPVTILAKEIARAHAASCAR